MSDHPAATSGHEAPNAAATTPITVEQAAAILGVSVTTVKRRIRAGTIRAEQATRAQGTVWLVYLPAAATPAAEERPPAASVAATTAATPTAPAEAIAAMIQATLTPIIGPLVAELAASRETIAAQGETIRDQAETIGELRATMAAQDAKIATLTAPTSTQAPKPSPSFGRHAFRGAPGPSTAWPASSCWCW